MEKNEKDIEVVAIKYKILAGAYLVVLAVLVGATVKTESDNLLIASSVMMGILFLLNLRMVLINSRKVKSMNIYKKDVVSTDLHPLELYMIDSIWHHKKKKFSKRQIYAALLYEIELNNLEYTDKGIGISPNVRLEQLSVYSLITMEMVLFNKVDCRKIRRLKVAKLRNIQAEGISIVMDDVKANIASNCSDTHLYYEQTIDMKNKYFEDIESKATVFLTIISWISVLLTVLIVIHFCNQATIINFYIPTTIAVLLVATLTSKNRERVIIKESARLLVIDALNYIEYLSRAEETRINQLYAYCLEKSNDSRIISPFNVLE